MGDCVCPVCAASAYFYYKYNDFFDADVDIYKCINCGHGFHNKQYSADDLLEIYRDEYAGEYIDSANQAYQKRQHQYNLDVEMLLEYTGDVVMNVLDFGCSSGAYLDAMPSTWVKAGFEVNPVEIEHIRKNKGHIDIYDNLGEIEPIFELVTLRGVIEHIPDHSELILFLKSHVAIGGFVYISATPDFSSICAAMYKSKWNQITCPEHIHQFTSASLSLLLAKAGFVLNSITHPYRDTPYADWNSDKKLFMSNFEKFMDGRDSMIEGGHAFPGTMMTALFEKVT